MFQEFPDILCVNEVAKILAVGRNTAYKLLRENQIRHLKIGKSIKIPKQYLIDFIEGNSYNTSASKGTFPVPERSAE